MNWWQGLLTGFGCFYFAGMLIFGIMWLKVKAETKLMQAQMQREMLRMQIEYYSEEGM